MAERAGLSMASQATQLCCLQGAGGGCHPGAGVPVVAQEITFGGSSLWFVCCSSLLLQGHRGELQWCRNAMFSALQQALLPHETPL